MAAKKFKVEFKDGILTLDEITGIIPPVDPPVDPPIEPPVLAKNKRDGVNCFTWGPQDKKDAFGLERLYVGLGWVWRNGELCTFEPAHQADGNFDTYFRNAKAKGKTIIPAFSWKPEWMSTQTNPDWSNERLSDYGRTGDTPGDYSSVAKFAFQFSARYGRKAWPENVLRVNTVSRWTNDPVNKKLSGQDLIQYVAFENEPNRHWKTPACQYTPAQLAAFMSATWDGHQGKMGANLGAKSGDPTMKVVLPGLSFMDENYLTEYKREILKIRTDGSLCFDVGEVHHYCNAANGPLMVNINGHGVSPQADDFSGRCTRFMQWAKSTFPGIPWQLGEFGWDTETSTQGAPGTGMEQERVQGQYIVDAFKIGLAAGFERMMLYELYDQAFVPGLFQRSGLLKQQSLNFEKKASFDMVVAYLNE